MKWLLVLPVVLWLLTLVSVGSDAVSTPEATIPPVVAPTTTTTAPPLLLDVAPTIPVRRLSVSSTAYCETGMMANGKPAHDGAVSSNFLPRGSRWRVLTGPYTGRVFTVEDTGSKALFDIAIPGGCNAARDYGRKYIDIEAA